MAQKGFYIYCITDLPNEQIPLGKGGMANEEAEIFTIQYLELSAVVSESEIKQFQPTRKNNFVHEAVIERVMKNGNVLPFRFGVVANNKAEIQKLLKDRRNLFKELLATVDGMVEIGVKVLFQDLGAILSQIGDTHPVIQQLKKEKRNISGNQSLIIEVGKIIEGELNEISQGYKDKIYQRLSSISAKAVISGNASNEMILNASFLIDKNKEGEFDSLLHHLDEENGGRLNFKCVGPFPPFNFVRLQD
jgi:hypothetical protein